MDLGNAIIKLRQEYNISQEKLAQILSVSRQAVQKWESNASVPETGKLIQISKHFGISLDAMLLNCDLRKKEELSFDKKYQPNYGNINKWELYSSQLITEYEQSKDEGKDIEQYKNLFSEVSKMPNGAIKEKMADCIFEIVSSASQRTDYKYIEPSEYDAIKDCSEGPMKLEQPDEQVLKGKIEGAWTGRICGCLLGKPVEGIMTNEMDILLKSSGNYPMQRYIRSSDITDEIIKSFSFGIGGERCWSDKIDAAPVDDDTNYTVLAQVLIDKYGKDFTPRDVSQLWLDSQPKNAYCTAERIAFKNFVDGFETPVSAVYKNPCREWIGAQIRGDYFGYINPAKPEKAAEMAWRDASVSHVKNGIYGEMFAAAMIAAAASADDMEQIIKTGLACIPSKSRLYETVSKVVSLHGEGKSAAECIKYIHSVYDEKTGHGWCHTIPNAMIVTASLLYGENDFGKTVCMAVQAGFDTDCNGATAGSVIGMRNGIKGIGAQWTEPIGGTLKTSIFGYESVKIADLTEKTLEHIKLLK